MCAHRPGWQTEELAEEWVDQDEHSSARWQDSVSSHAVSSSDISLTEALPSTFIRGGSSSPAPAPMGTFIVREDVQATPFLPKTPGKKSKNQIKDFFSPMPLETMFEPPSPPQANDKPLPSTSTYRTAIPAIPSRLSKVYVPNESSTETDHGEEHVERRFGDDDEILETDIPNMVGFDGRKPSLNCQFTFSVPDSGPSAPMAQSTPSGQSNILQHRPQTDPRLRLFQFQYDTFTRDHLSAMVDSIAVNTPSAGSGTPSPVGNVLPRVVDAQGDMSFGRMRSAKRLKLSPADDYSDEDEVSPPPRPNSRRDYVGESKDLMDQIRQARDVSTMSTVLSAQSLDNSREETTAQPQVGLEVPHNSTSTTGSKRSDYSSLGYRQKAADLMAQIKQDMTASKRIFSGDTDVSHITRVESDAPLSNKENEPHTRPGTRKPKRKQTTTTDEELAIEVKNMSIEVWQTRVHFDIDGHPSEPPRLAVIPPTPQMNADGPSYPATSLRGGTNEDLNRFVSSSTATGTTLTAGSAPSFVKHHGPQNAVRMTRLGPDDVKDALSDRVGRMVFNRETMRWVRDAAIANGPAAEAVNGSDFDGESEDPFKDIESLRDDDSRVEDGESRIEEIIEEEEERDVEEVALNSFSFDDSSAAVVPVMTGVETEEEDYAVDDQSTTDSDDSRDADLDSDTVRGQFHNMREENEDITLDFQEPNVPAFGTPLPSRRGPAGSTPFPSVLAAMKSNSVTPVSAMKGNKTPVNGNKGRQRSVSFSDGKREGPIRGLKRDETSDESVDHAFVPSARSKRIANLLEGLEDPVGESVSKTSSRHSEEMQPLPSAPRRPTTFSNGSPEKRRSSYKTANTTFLTECSFAVTHDKLVQVITDVQPFEPYWEDLGSIDLSKKGIDSVARLKEFLPKLDSLCLNQNQIGWLSGIPGTVRTLSVASNLLTGVSSFSHLTNLENLDISRNDIDSLQQLNCLRHLRELRADGNKISSVDGLQKMDGLVKLSLQSNRIQEMDISGFRWTRLEMLNMSHNRLDNVRGLRSLPVLIALNLDNNSLTDLGLDENACLAKLRILRVSGNKLQKLDGGNYPNLRTLYADNNALSGVMRSSRLKKLENLSLRNQAKGRLNFSIRDVRDIKRLYLSGNPLTSRFMTEPCYNLVYFELAACRLTALPANFAKLIPNVRVLNLNYNFLEDVKPLEGLTRIKKMTIIGSRVAGTKGLIRMAQGMPEVEMVDFRMNPCTLGWYLPLLVKEAGESKYSWEEMDSKFRRELPDSAYVGRLAYRGLIMRGSAGMRVLDGVEVSAKEREKAERLLSGMLGG